MMSITPSPPAKASSVSLKSLKTSPQDEDKETLHNKSGFLIYLFVTDLYFSFQKAGNVALPLAKEAEILDASPSVTQTILKNRTNHPGYQPVPTFPFCICTFHALQPCLELSECPSIVRGLVQILSPTQAQSRRPSYHEPPTAMLQSGREARTSDFPQREAQQQGTGQLSRVLPYLGKGR